MKDILKRLHTSVLVKTFRKLGYEIKPKGLGYFDAPSTVRNANASGLSLCDYLESNNIGGVGKRRDTIISQLMKTPALAPCETIIEIGAGTGMYLEKFLTVCRPRQYEVYETSVGWARYLNETYSADTNLIVHDADGHTLAQTPDSSADVVCAHAVFVYLPVVQTFQYLKEAVRVCKRGAFIIFDCFTDEIFSLKEILVFKQNNPGHDWPVVISADSIRDFCNLFQLRIVSTFETSYHSSKSLYYVIKKT